MSVDEARIGCGVAYNVVIEDSRSTTTSFNIDMALLTDGGRTHHLPTTINMALLTEGGQIGRALSRVRASKSNLLDSHHRLDFYWG